MIALIRLRWQWVLQHIKHTRHWNAWNAEKQYPITEDFYGITWWPTIKP